MNLHSYWFQQVIKYTKKKGKPFTVHKVQEEQFYDLKKLSSEIGYNYKENKYGENKSWNEIKMIKVEKDNPFLLKYKTSYSDDEYKIINIRKKC